MGKNFSGPLSCKIFNGDSTHTPVNKQSANLVNANNRKNTSKVANFCEVCNVTFENAKKHTKTKAHIRLRKKAIGLL
jgi:hypothetical protein